MTFNQMQHVALSQGKIVQTQNENQMEKQPKVCYKMDEGDKLYHSGEQIGNKPNNPLIEKNKESRNVPSMEKNSHD